MKPLLYLSLFIFIGSAYSRTCKKGIIDLSEYDFSSKQPASLNGEWLFSWNQFDKLLHTRKSNYINVPGNWTNFTKASLGESHLGHCTYGLKLLLPKNRIWSIKLPPIHSSYKLYIDGELKSSAGVPQKNVSSIPSAVSQTVHFFHNGGEVLLTLEVANYHFSSGGIWSPIKIGSPKAIEEELGQAYLRSAFLIGALIIMGFYHLFLFLLWKKKREPLYFALICFFIALRESFSGEALFFSLFPNFNYEFAIKTLYATFPVCLMAFILFFSTLYNYSKWLKRGGMSICLCYLGLILCTNNTIYGNLLPIISILFLIETLYILYLVVSHTLKEPKQNLLIAISLVILILCFLNDILYDMGKVHTAFLLPFGFFVFTLCQSLLLSIRFSRAFHQTEILGIELLKNQELRSIEEMKNRFYSSITHEFKTPLSLIISPVEKLMKGALESEKTEKLYKTIHRNAMQLVQLINQLLDLSKLDAKSTTIAYSLGDMNKYCHDMVDTFSSLAIDKNIELRFKSHRIPETLMFDSDKLEKVCLNLLSNAFKFTPNYGKITLTIDGAPLRENKNQVLITVTDNGIGIPAEEQQKVFKRFYQVENPYTRGISGSGIGLALVKELIELLGGTIKLESEINKGTTFKIHYPVTLTSNTKPENEDFTVHDNLVFTELNQSQIFIASDDASKPTILIAEDNTDLSNYLSEELKANYRILISNEGESAWEICQRELPELVISDIMMPLMDGFQLCHLIKNTESTNHIGVILLTAKSNTESRLKGLTIGANDYLPKPFLFEELLIRINNSFKYQESLKEYYRKQLIALYTKAEPENISQNPFLEKLYSIMESQMDNSEFSVTELAMLLSLSPRTLHRKVIALIGIPPNEVIKKFRLKKASELLKQGYNISETAYMVGFESPSYFGQCFKEMYEVTPSEFLSSKI